MGLFDFLKRKPEPEPGPEPAFDLDLDLDEDAAGPSPHYAFAHFALRDISLSSPLEFLSLLASPNAKEFLGSVLQDVSERCGRQASFGVDSIKIHRGRVNKFPCVVIKLPEPQEFAEAFMVALVVLTDTSQANAAEDETVEARYFTLEKAVPFADEEVTVLAEWKMGSHLNYGDGPSPKVDAFVAAISGLV